MYRTDQRHEAESFFIKWSVARLVKKQSSFYETWSFITVFTKAPLDLYLEQIQFTTPSHAIH